MSIMSSLTNFRTNKTHCFEPKDRELVEARIKEAWGDVDKFDTFVKTQLSREMSNNIGAADLPPIWNTLVVALPWTPFFSVIGLVQVSGEQVLSFWQVLLVDLTCIGVCFPLAMTFWYYFSFSIYKKLAHRPRVSVGLVTAWTMTNCTLSMCVFCECLDLAFRQPLAMGAGSIALLTAFFTGATYYFHVVEKRASQCEFTCATILVLALLWVPAYLLLNLGPATAGCTHWSCVWPHGVAGFSTQKG